MNNHAELKSHGQGTESEREKELEHERIAPERRRGANLRTRTGFDPHQVNGGVGVLEPSHDGRVLREWAGQVTAQLVDTAAVNRPEEGAPGKRHSAYIAVVVEHNFGRPE